MRGVVRALSRATTRPSLRHFQKFSSLSSNKFSYLDSTSPYARKPLGRDWDKEELDTMVARGYRHPEVDVQAYLLDREINKAMEVFEGFKHFADAKVWSQILWAYGRNGHVKRMADLYFEMTREHKLRPSELTFCSMIKAINRTGAYEASFRLYQEEIKTREYIRCTYSVYYHLLKACRETKNDSLSEKLWDDYLNYYKRNPVDSLWTARMLVATKCGNWPLIAKITREMDQNSHRLRALSFREILRVSPDNVLPQHLDRPMSRFKRTIPQYSVKPWKEKQQKIHFSAQVDFFELVPQVAAYITENDIKIDRPTKGWSRVELMNHYQINRNLKMGS
ncbi:hypothetical protein AAMO2058_001462400 [Amorphochlora amoebiformis]|mmetsp:Transcript_11187/g.17691  ORF Transcript_11187/g.17691 Transcript_11187/m.17691 type:complete len:336 (-) Transcript_11187:111-1118(-)